MSWPGWRAVATSSPLPFPCKPRDCARFEPTGLRTACPRSHDRTTGAASAVGLVVRSEDASRDTAAVADLVTALARPLPDCAQVAATLTRRSPCPARVLAAPRATIPTMRKPVRQYCWIVSPNKPNALDRLPTWNAPAAHDGRLRALP